MIPAELVLIPEVKLIGPIDVVPTPLKDVVNLDEDIFKSYKKAYERDDGKSTILVEKLIK